MSNACATGEPLRRTRAGVALVLAVLHFALGAEARAQAQPEPTSASSPPSTNRSATVGLFIAGGALGLAAHEGGHLLFDVAFSADPGVRKVDFHGIPFFAITHRADLPRGQEFTISSAGFWVQHAGSEWLLTRRPRLRDEHAPLAKGILAFNVLASGAYAGAAFFRTGPGERDTRGMADSAGIDERWIGAAILAPALLDTWRYFHPESPRMAWMSRAVKIGGALLVIRAATRESPSTRAGERR